MGGERVQTHYAELGGKDLGVLRERLGRDIHAGFDRETPRFGVRENSVVRQYRCRRSIETREATRVTPRGMLRCRPQSS
jgi:hypothetical protein